MQYLIDHHRIGSDSHDIIEKSNNPTDFPIIKAIQSLKASFFNVEIAMDALAEAETIGVQGQNIYLLLIFLELRAKLSIKLGRITEGLAIISQIKAIVTDDMPDEYKIISNTCESCFYLQDGKSQQAELLIEKSLSKLIPSSERHQYLLLEYAMHLSLQCRLNQVKEDIARINIETSDSSTRTLSSLVLYIDCLNRSDLEFAKVIILSIDRHSEIFKFYQKEFNDAIKMNLILNYNSGNISENEMLIELNKTKDEEFFIYLELIKKRPQESLKILQSINLDSDEYLKRLDMSAFLPLRVELSCGHLEIAKSLLNQKGRLGNHHFFDHLYWARIEYLAGNLDNSKRHFKTVYENCLKNDCLSRLEFEIELTYEFKNKDIQLFWDYAKNPLTASNNLIPVSHEKPEMHHAMLGESPELNSVFENIRQFGPLDLPVLIIGETGTGKELTAQALHNESKRKNKLFLAINCGAISESLLQSELFGYEQGAFTGASKFKMGILEEAGEGTVFLDEIGEVSPAIQVALLRVLENNEIRTVGGTKPRKLNCRIIAATNAQLAELVEKNKFRKDLLYRLQRFQITLPSLRERKEDIKTLALYYLSKERQSKDIEMSENFVNVIENYPWPGNIRELRNEMERLALLNPNKNLFTELDLPQSKFQTAKLNLIEQSVKENLEPIANELHSEEQKINLPKNKEPEIKEDSFDDDENQELSDNPEDFQLFLNNRNSPLRRKMKLKKIFLKFKSLSRGEVARVMNLALNTAAKDLEALEKEGFIERIKPTTSARTHYFTLVKK